MIRKLQKSLFPLSISHYSIGLTVITLALVGCLVLFANQKVQALNNEANRKNADLASQELNYAIEQSVLAAARIADSFAHWEETLQQLANPVYYNFWRTNRAMEANFLQDYFTGLELYGIDGEPLGRQTNIPAIPKINNNLSGAFFAAHNNRISLFYVSDITRDGNPDNVYGHVVVDVDFNNVLNKVQKFNQLDYTNLRITLDTNNLVPVNDIKQYFHYNISPNEEYIGLNSLLSDTLLQLAFISVISIVGFLYIIITLTGKPLAALSLQIDALNNGDYSLLQQNCSGFRLVMEFNKLRQSLNDYLRQLEKLEQVAAGDLDAAVIQDKDKEVSGLMQSFNSIVTQLKQTMEEKDRVSLQLREQADDLRHASEQAMLATQTKSAFLANMSHEIRTPLTAIIGFAETSLDDDQTMSERMEALHTIVKSGRHLLQVINDILDLSKVEANKLDIEITPVSLFQIVADVESLVKFHAIEKDIEFAVSYTLPLPLRIATDPMRLKQIILNLCNNAIKFTSVGHVHLNVRSDLVDRTLIFEVLDTGIGLSELQIDNIFKPFTQADVSTSRKYGGTGLGLSLSKSLCEMLGGKISVKSKPDVGSKFTVVIPVGETGPGEFIHDVSQIPRTIESQANNRNFSLLHGSVLAVDDVPENQKLLRVYLKKMGLQVTLADNGFKAIELARAHPFDLILMDIQMPVVDGMEATSTLRSEGISTPIIAITANALKEDRDRYLRSGFDGYITKPVNRHDLYEILKKHLKQDSRQQQSMTPILSVLDDEEGEFTDLVEKFVKTLPDQFRRIKKAFNDNDWKQLKSLLHETKGTSGNMGFPSLMLCVTNIESIIEANNFANLESAIGELESLCRRIAHANWKESA
ncbi:MAG: response regulator [Gammaproteobacteria bacterium]|nr:response regulator [Gammaproteobacteria bacterium]